MPLSYEVGSVVWAKLGQNWWPGRVGSFEDCPQDYTSELKKKPFAIVKFFNESGIHEVTREDFICSYNCSRKDVYIKKGLKSVHSDGKLKKKLEDDIVMAEKLTGGNMNIIQEINDSGNSHKRRIDYSDLGFGVTKPRNNIQKDQPVQKRGFTNIGEAILYKRGISPVVKTIEYKSKLMEQPKATESMAEEMRSSGNFKCVECGFTCSRVEVIVWHNKGHIKKVVDFSFGLNIPRKRKRKSKQAKSLNKQIVDSKSSEAKPKMNGHATLKERSMDASQLLQDWDDGDNVLSDDENEVNESDRKENATYNGPQHVNEREIDCSDSDAYEDSSSRYIRERQPMPRQIDINSAFDALLAESSTSMNPNSTSVSTSSAPNFANNDSDSDGNDWDKYFKRNASSDSEAEEESHSKSPQASKISRRRSSSTSLKKEKSKQSIVKAFESTDSPSSNTANHGAKSTDDHSTQSSNSSSSSGPAYMLVAVDAQGNNVPMPVLSEGGNHMVAVEASMEDGTTRTLYIDPAHLGPNVDLNNLMLHIDNSGQETVIISTSNADGDSSSTTSTTTSTTAETSLKDPQNSDGKELQKVTK